MPGSAGEGACRHASVTSGLVLPFSSAKNFSKILFAQHPNNCILKFANQLPESLESAGTRSLGGNGRGGESESLGRNTSKLATATSSPAWKPQIVDPITPPPAKSQKQHFVRLTLWPLVAATFFMVSGGTFGTEDIVHGAGYGKGILILLITPLLWALPVAFMIGELSSALPKEGGFYAWVRRGLGDFWGFQEAWLSLVASIFDMAIYPTLFVTYLNRLFPWFAEGAHHLAVGDRDLMVAAGVVLFCALLNVAGVRVVATTSVWLFFLLSAPFVLIVVLAPFKFGALTHATAHNTGGVSADILAGLLVCMWNYMGWDNASTVAAEVERPARTYPRAMLYSVLIVAVSYVLPIAAMWLTGLPPAQFETGSWADIAGMLGGPLLRGALVLAAMASAFGMFNSLVMSYSRLPLAMAQDGMLPSAFGKLHSKTRAPWVAIAVLALAWTLCLGIGFERLITIDILLYGTSLFLEFAALIALRFREPELVRPFRVPGGLFGALFIGVPPMLLVLVFSVARGQSEHILGMSSFLFGMALIAAGFVAYAVNMLLKPQGWSATADETAQPMA